MNIDKTSLNRIRASQDPSTFSSIANQPKNEEKIQICSRGDSWFAYPREWLIFGADSNVISCLNEYHDLLILDGSHNGIEAEAMLSGDDKLSLLRRLSLHNFDVLLLSGGGNDIVGKYDFDFFIKPWKPGAEVDDCIEWDHVNRRLKRIRDSYIDIIELSKTYAQNGEKLKLVTHTYDWAIPDPHGATFVGGFLKVDSGRSWMWPYLHEKGYYGDGKTPRDTPVPREIVKRLLQRFAETLIEVSTAYPNNFFVVNTQGTLADNDWLNEIHPTPQGFKKIANKIHVKLMELFP